MNRFKVADLWTERKKRTTYRNRSEKYRTMKEQTPKAEIMSIGISLYSTKQIDQMSVVTVFSEQETGANSVRDLKMGPISEGTNCETCGEDFRDCPGHYGKIIIPKMFNPQIVPEIIDILGIVCNDCGKLLITEDEIKLYNIHYLKGVKRLSAIKEKTMILDKVCDGSREDPNDPYREVCRNRPIFYPWEKGNHVITYACSKNGKNLDGSKQVFNKTPDEVYKIFDCISDEDAALLGFNDCHPRDMIMERIIVPPNCARLDLTSGGRVMPSDLTRVMSDLVRRVNEYEKTVSLSDKIKRDAILRSIFFTYSHMIRNSDGKYTLGRSRPVSDIHDQLQGKEALIRRNIESKRVNFAARTVVAPGPELRLDQFGVPVALCEKLTFGEKISNMNYREAQIDLEEGRVKYIEFKNGEKMIYGPLFKERYPNYHVQPGDTIHRHLKKDDIILYNRQPSLQKENMIAARVYPLPKNEKVCRLNLSSTTPLNADCDGDELNLHVPQGEEARVESMELLHIKNLLMNEQNNTAMMGIVYTTLTAAYIVTNPDCIIDEFIVKQCLKKLEPDLPQMKTYYQRLKKYNVNPLSGRGMVSSVFPEYFNYSKGDLLIQEGIFIDGRLTKDSIGPKKNNIITHMYEACSPEETVNFISNIQFLLNEYITYRGFTATYEDCTNRSAGFRDEINKIVTETSTIIETLSVQRCSNQIEESEKERKISEILDGATSRTEKLAMSSLSVDNNLIIMANAGTKGSAFNIARITSMIGQQRVSGNRIPCVLPGNRSLSTFPPKGKYDPEKPEERGFCTESFNDGLRPSSLFFHMCGSWETLADQAIGTASTGYLQRQMTRSAEDLHINSLGALVSTNQSIVQYVYGNDGLDAGKLRPVKIEEELFLFYCDVGEIADTISNKYDPY